MKKITLVSIASFLFLFVSSAVAVLSRYLFSEALAAFLVGLAVLIGSGVLSLLTGERVKLNLLCFFISAVAMGVLMRAWYIVRGFDNSFITVMGVTASVVLYLWIFYALSRIPFVRSSHLVFIIFVIMFVIISAVLYVIVMANTETTYVSTFGYYMIIELGFIFAMSLEAENKEELIKNLAHSTYSVFIVAIVVGVAVLVAALGGDCDCDCDCDGDCDCGSCDGGDCGCGDGTETARRKKKSGTRIDLE